MQSSPRIRRYLHTNADDEDAPFIPLTTMVNVFLEDIAQPYYLSDLELHLGRDFANVTQLEDSFANEKAEWQIYTIGFIMFLTVGVLVAIVLVVLGPIVVFCLVKNKGPCRRVLTVKPSTLTRLSWITFGLVVIVSTILMLLVIIPMLVMSVWIRHHCENTLFARCTEAVKALSVFLKKTAEELRAKSIGSIQAARNRAFGALDMTPHSVSLAFDLTTENQTNVKRLHKLGTQELPKLKENLEDIMSMINTSKIHERVERAERPSDSQSSAAHRPEIAQKLVALLHVVNMATTNDSKTTADSKPLAQQMSEADAELQAMKNNMTKSVNNPAADIKSQMDQTEAKIKEFVDTASSLSFDFLIDALQQVHEYALPAINGVFAFLVILFLMLLSITVLYVTAFVLYFPYYLPKYKFSRRDRTIQAGKTLFRAVVYTILLTSWLYWLAAAVAMYFGGQAHTEICRHLTHPQGLRSRRVIRILDAYLMSKLFGNSPRQSFRILETYVECEKDRAIYAAANVQTLWRFDDMFDLSELQKATNRLGNINLTIPQANLLSSELKAIMLRLEDLHNKIDMAGMSQRLEASALAEASMPNTDTERSPSPKQNLPNIHEHNKKLAGKLSEIAYDMASYDFGNLSRALEENQKTFGKTGEDVTRRVTRNISTEVYNVFAEAVQNIKNEIENNIGHCRSMYDYLKSALAEPCIQILYPFNAFWFSLGMANLILIPIFITSYKLSDFLDSYQSQGTLPMSNTTTENPQLIMATANQNLDQPRENPQQKMATANQNLDQPQASLKPRKSKSNRVAANQNLDQPRENPQQKIATANQNLVQPQASLKSKSNRVAAKKSSLYYYQ